MMHGMVSVNGDPIATWRIQRLEPQVPVPLPGTLCRYQVDVGLVGEGSQRHEIQHYYGGGALALLHHALGEYLHVPPVDEYAHYGEDL